MSGVRIVHLTDLHFGAYVDLEQIAVLERLVPELAPAAIVISGDLTQRARHGEFQRALAFVEQLRHTAPTLVVPGNHDVRWWSSPFGLRGELPKYRHYRRYFGDTLGPVLAVPGLIIAGTVSAHGLAGGSVTRNPRDLTVKGHLPRSETDRAREAFQQAEPGACRVLVLHHNVLRGRLSNRWGLARPLETQDRIAAAGAELVLCGHDHEEAVAPIAAGTIVAQGNTHSSMTRGRLPSVFNLIDVARGEITIRWLRWRRPAFEANEEVRFPRLAASADLRLR